MAHHQKIPTTPHLRHRHHHTRCPHQPRPLLPNPTTHILPPPLHQILPNLHPNLRPLPKLAPSPQSRGKHTHNIRRLPTHSTRPWSQKENGRTPNCYHKNQFNPNFHDIQRHPPPSLTRTNNPHSRSNIHAHASDRPPQIQFPKLLTQPRHPPHNPHIRTRNPRNQILNLALPILPIRLDPQQIPIQNLSLPPIILSRTSRRHGRRNPRHILKPWHPPHISV